jgi:hypothetical protein
MSVKGAREDFAKWRMRLIFPIGDVGRCPGGSLLEKSMATGSSRRRTFIHLGVLLHFFIALSGAAVYYETSRRLPFLKQYPLICGLFYGAAVEVVMGYVVLPLSALHDRGPYELHDVLQGLAVHMIVIGLPISFSVRHFAK